MKKTNLTTRFGLLKIAVTLSLMLLFTAPLLAQGNGGPHHPPPPPPPPHWRDTIPPPPPHWNDSIPPPHWGGDTSGHHGNDSVPPPPPPPPFWNDSVPPPPPFWNDSVPPPHCDTTRHGRNDTMRWNDSIPPPPYWNDTIHPHGCNGDTNTIDRIQNKASISIYPNPVVQSANMHIANATATSGNLTFNLYEQSGRLVLTLPNLTNGDVQLNKNGLIPGIYIYELRNANSVISTGRVVIQ